MTELKCKIIEVCVFTRNTTEPQYLLLKRAENETIYPGIWQFITGGIHDNEKAYEAAYRELREETGLIPKRFFTVPHVSIFYDAGYDAVNFAPAFAAEINNNMTPKLSAEHATWKWCTYNEASDLLVWPAQNEGLTAVHNYIVGGSEAGHLLDITEKLSLQDEKSAKHKQ